MKHNTIKNANILISIISIVVILALMITNFSYMTNPPRWMGEAAMREYVDYMYFGGGLDNYKGIEQLVYFLRLIIITLQVLGLFFINNIMKEVGSDKILVKGLIIGIMASILIKFILYFLQVKYKIYMDFIDSAILGILVLDTIRIANKNKYLK